MAGPGGSRGRAPPEPFKISFEDVLRPENESLLSLFRSESGIGAAELSFDNLSEDFVRTVTYFGLVMLGVSSTMA